MAIPVNMTNGLIKTNSEKNATITFIQIKFLLGNIYGINELFFNVILMLTKVNLLKKNLNF